MTVLVACPRRAAQVQVKPGFGSLFFLCLLASLPPAMRGIDGKQLAFLSFPTFSWHDHGSTVPSNLARWMSSFLSIFEKPRCERPFLRLCFARRFSSCAPRRVRARPTNGHDLWPNLYSDFIHVAVKEGRRMHGGAPIRRIIRVWF